MARNDDDFTNDFWLHVATDGLRRYAQDGGKLLVVATPEGLIIKLPDVVAENEHIHSDFAELIQVAGA